MLSLLIFFSHARREESGNCARREEGDGGRTCGPHLAHLCFGCVFGWQIFGMFIEVYRPTNYQYYSEINKSPISSIYMVFHPLWKYCITCIMFNSTYNTFSGIWRQRWLHPHLGGWNSATLKDIQEAQEDCLRPCLPCWHPYTFLSLPWSYGHGLGLGCHGICGKLVSTNDCCSCIPTLIVLNASISSFLLHILWQCSNPKYSTSAQYFIF